MSSTLPSTPSTLPAKPVLANASAGSSPRRAREPSPVRSMRGPPPRGRDEYRPPPSPPGRRRVGDSWLGDRYSPPPRDRYSPPRSGRYSPRGYSPRRSPPRDFRRRDDYMRRSRSPPPFRDGRRWRSPPPFMRRPGSPPSRRGSPSRRGPSPPRPFRGSPPRRSPPPRRANSPPRRLGSPPRRLGSPPPRRPGSPPPRRPPSPRRRRLSPQRFKGSDSGWGLKRGEPTPSRPQKPEGSPSRSEIAVKEEASEVEIPKPMSPEKETSGNLPPSSSSNDTLPTKPVVDPTPSTSTQAAPPSGPRRDREMKSPSFGPRRTGPPTSPRGRDGPPTGPRNNRGPDPTKSKPLDAPRSTATTSKDKDGDTLMSEAPSAPSAPAAMRKPVPTGPKPRPGPLLNAPAGPSSSEKTLPTGPAADKNIPTGPRVRDTGAKAESAGKDVEMVDAKEAEREKEAKAARDREREIESRLPPLPAIPKKEPLTPELDAEIGRLQAQRLALAAEHDTIAQGVRRAAHELAMASLDLKAAEKKRMVAEAQYELAGKGLLGAAS